MRFVIKKWRYKEAEDNKKKKLKPIHKDWFPNGDAKEILLKAGITEEFIQKELPEFIMYWKENGQSLTSWNSKFLQHVKYNWERNNNNDNKEHKKQLENRIESSWKIEEKPIMKSSSPQSSEKTRENFKKLKEKYQI